MLRQCEQCGGEFDGRGRARRCSPCYRAQKHWRLSSCGRCQATFEGVTGAKFCQGCRSLAMSEVQAERWKPRLKWVWTAERDALLRRRYDPTVKRRAAEIAAELGFPTWCVKRRAGVLGLTRPGKATPWTAEEEAVIRRHAGKCTLRVLADRLKRPEASTLQKLKRMGVSRRYREGYTMTQVSLGFGVDHKVIREWIHARKLRAVRRGSKRLHDAWVIRHQDLVSFVVENPMAFDLRFVEQTFFMSLVTEVLEDRLYGDA